MHISVETNSRAKELGESRDARHDTGHHVRNRNQIIVTPHRSRQLRKGTGEPRETQPTLHITIETLSRPVPSRTATETTWYRPQQLHATRFQNNYTWLPSV